MVIAAAGAVDHQAIVAEVEQRFASFNGPEGPLPRAGEVRRRRRASRSRDLEQVHVAFALEGVPQRDPSIYSLQVFTNILGGGMSSRLFQEVREIRGLCYAVYAFHAAYADTGMLGVYAGTDASDLPELMRVVVDEIGNAAETISEARDRALQGADEGGAADGAGKLRRARRAARAPDDDLRPPDPARGDRRQDRGRHGGERAGSRPRADRAQPAGGRRAWARARA